MSLVIQKIVFTGQGEKIAELYFNPMDRKIQFRQYFECHGFIPLIFDTREQILEYLEKNNDNQNFTYFILGEEVCRKENLENNILSYYATIKGEEYFE